MVGVTEFHYKSLLTECTPVEVQALDASSRALQQRRT